MKKVLVTGAGGMLGEAVAERFKDKYELVLTDKEELAVRYWDDWKAYAKYKYAYVIHLAALTDLELCESDPRFAYDTNSFGTEHAANFADAMDCPLIYISTAGVFDGTKDGYYTEEDVPNPINHYGKSKLAGEGMALQYDNTYVFRAGWMIGGGNRDKKFISYMIDQLRKGRKELKVVDDTVGSLTYTHDLANQIYMTVEQDADRGLYHACNGGKASRYEIAEYMLQVLGRTDVKLTPVKSSLFDKKFTTRRSPNESMENKRLNEKNINYMLNWSTAVKRYIERYYITSN